MGEESKSSGGFSLIKFEGKGLEKLVDVISSGIGVLYKPRAVRNEADAKAYEVVALAEAEKKASFIKAMGDQDIADLAERAKQRFVHQEVKRQHNIESVAAEAENNLSDTPSDQPVDEDWKAKFFNKAQDVSSEDLQKVWGKILANEVNKPGAVSVRTLDILSNLSTLEAKTFKKVSSLCTHKGSIIKISDNELNKYNVSYNDLLELRAAGLLHYSDDLFLILPSIHEGFNDLPTSSLLIFKGDVTILLSQTGEPNMQIPQFMLTPAGVELLPILGEPININYLNDVAEFMRKRQFAADIMLFTEAAEKLNAIGKTSRFYGGSGPGTGQ